MSKIIDFFNKRKEKTPYEYCVICKCKTHIKKEQHIEKRYGYIEGIGQLCFDCYKDLENNLE